LTTKFTQHTTASPLPQTPTLLLSFRAKRGICFPFVQHNPLPSHHTPFKFHGPLNLLLARLLQLQYSTVLPSQGKPRDLETGSTATSCYVHQQVIQALIKIYVRLVIYPIYSVVKYRPRWPRQLSRLCSYGFCSLQNHLRKTFARF